jgi:hypothetical protein
VKEPAGYTAEGVHVTYRAVGSITFDEAVGRVRSAIALARSTKARDLLVDTTAWTGFSSPDRFQRFLAAVAWAEEAGGRLVGATRMVSQSKSHDSLP